MAKRESLGRCPLCRRQLWRPVQTVRAQDRVYHLTCWQEAMPTKKRAEDVTPFTLATFLDHTYHPDPPLTHEGLADVLRWARRAGQRQERS